MPNWLKATQQRLRGLWYSFTCWAWHRHTTIKPRTLPHTWVDRCELLPHLMFEVLGRFLEEELNWKLGDPCDDDGVELLELKELWRWWNNDYLTHDPWQHTKGLEEPKCQRKEMDLGGVVVYETTWECSTKDAEKLWNEKMGQVRQASNDMVDELQDRCKRLIDVMEWMWT